MFMFHFDQKSDLGKDIMILHFLLVIMLSHLMPVVKTVTAEATIQALSQSSVATDQYALD